MHAVPRPDWRLGMNLRAADGSVPADKDRETRLWAMRAAFYGVPSGLGVRLAMALFVGAFFAVGMYTQGVKYLGPGDRVGAGVVAVLAGAAGAFGIFRLNVRPPDYRVVGAHLAASRLCLCCGYGLAGVPPQQDGCTVCPECGAAWVLPRPPSPPA